MKYDVGIANIKIIWCSYVPAGVTLQHCSEAVTSGTFKLIVHPHPSW